MKNANLIKPVITLAILVVANLQVNAQNTVGIGTTSPNQNAVLELYSPTNDQGLLVPRITSGQRTSLSFSSNENGLLVFDLDLGKFFYWYEGDWYPLINVVSGPAGGDLTGTFPNPQLADGVVATVKLADGSVTGIKIADGEVSTIKLADGAVNSAKLASDAIDSTHIKTSSISRTDLSDNIISSNKIQDGEVQSADLASQSVTIDKINSGGLIDKVLSTDGSGAPVWEDKSAVLAGALGRGLQLDPSNQIEVNPGAGLTFNGLEVAVDADNTTIGSDIANGIFVMDDGITLSKIAHGTGNEFLTTDIAGIPQWETKGAIHSALAGNGLVWDAANNEIDADVDNLTIEIDGVTDQLQVRDLGITSAKLAADAVTSDKIAPETIVNEDVNAAAAIDGTKINPAFGTQNISTTGTLSAGASSVTDLAATGTVTLSANSIQSTEIEDLTIVDADVNAAAAIAGTKISPDFGAQAITTTGTLNADGAVNLGATGIATTIEGTLAVNEAATLNSAAITNNTTVGGTLGVSGTATFDATNGITLQNNVNEFSTDGTLAGNSNTALPTEQAVKTYVDTEVGAINALSDGLIYVGDGTNTAQEVAISGDATLANNGALTIANDAINSAKIVDGGVVASDLEGLTSGQFIIGTDGTAANNAKVIMSGDATLNNTGVLTISADAISSTEVALNSLLADDIATGAVGTDEILNETIVDNDISTTAAITRSKLASGTANHVIINDGTGTITSEAHLAIARGGTGAATANDARINLGLAIGTNVQAYDADLTTYAGISPSTDIQTLLGSADAATARTNIGLGNVENTALSTWAGSANITTLGTVGTGTWQGNVVAPAYGGTGVNASTATNGQLLIGNGSGFSLANITGTVNQVSVVNGAGTITLSTPQEIHTGATPTFAGLDLNGALAMGANNITSTGSISGETLTDGTFSVTSGNISTSGTLSSGAAAVTSLRVTSLGDGSASFINGDGTITSTSDRRLKTNISSIDSALFKILNAAGVQYNFKNDTSTLHTGVIAQEIEKLFPHLVRTDERGYKSVNYIEIIPILMEAMKEQQQTIADLENKVIKNEQEVTSLSATVSQQKFENEKMQNDLQAIKAHLGIGVEANNK